MASGEPGQAVIAFTHMRPGRPRAVVHVAIVVIAATVVSLNFFAWDVFFGDADPFLLKAAAFVVLIRATVLWFFWKGKNWARIFLLVAAVLGLLQGLRSMTSGHTNWLEVMPQISACLFLLIWLNRLKVKQWYKPDYPQDFKDVQR